MGGPEVVGAIDGLELGAINVLDVTQLISKLDGYPILAAR